MGRSRYSPTATKVLACDPPHRIVVAWQITAQGDAWVYDPDITHASEFEVNFREQPDGQTRVELEHRGIGRHGPGAAGIHQGVSSPGGWPGILDNYAGIAAA
ncbi:MAG TPA: SRPBCC domain-containing protein [Streptosporangiaceae bacterium]